MDDLEPLIDQLTRGAERRGLTIVDASFPGEPTFILDHESTSVDEALDLAQQMLAPFIAISVAHLDADELIHSIDETPAPLARLARKRDGQAMGLELRWYGLGATALYLAGTDWAGQLADLRAQWESDRRASWNDERETRAVRIAHLAEQIELDPRYRAATQTQRTTVGRVVLDELRNAEDDATTLKWSLENASRALRENSALAYAPLEAAIDDLSSDLRESEGWRATRTARERDVVTRAYLLEHTGYAAPVAFVAQVARLAAKSR
ncbi:hypothetical protein [Microbacterium sp.]|uniref:hypothetical protein n=1 Tax=Microbacterium sp. TaxID=51671 RepID=UPI00391D8238